MRKFKQILSVILIATLSMTILASCDNSDTSKGGGTTPAENKDTGDRTDNSGSKTKDVLIVADRREAKTLIPYGSNDAGTSTITYLIYDTLLTFDENMNLLPSLATEWEKVDDTHYIFKLREDVYFHNGDKFTSQDVIDSFKYSSKAPATESLLGVIDIENSKVIDEYTVELALKEPFAPFLNNLSLAVASIVNKKAIEEGGDNYNDNPVGTGPFIYKSWKSGDTLELTSNKEYWGEKANFNTLIIRQIPEATTRVVEVETGGVDIALAVLDSDAKTLAGREDVNLISKNILNTSYLSFNCEKEPFNNPKVRQAISLALDTETIVQNAKFGLGEVSYSPVAPDVFGYYKSETQYDYNLEKAKELLIEAGYPDGFTTTLTNNSDVMIAEMAQNMLGKIGITVEIQQLDFANWLDALVNGKQEMYIGGWTAPSGDAYEALEAFHSRNFGSGGNRSFYSNPELDKILDDAKVEMDPDKRLDLYRKAQDLIAEEAVYVNLYVGSTHVLTSSEIESLPVIPSQNFDFWKVKFK